MRYQETWIKGKSAGKAHQRECAGRYAPIREALSRYTRPFSVFDFGANMGYFAFRIAEDFPQATVIAVDGHRELGDLARQNGLANVIAITRRMNGDDLASLARCEAFDVVLALNVLHHMADWRDGFDALSALGSQAIIETPGAGDHASLQRGNHAEIKAAVEARKAEELARFPSHKSPGAERIMYRLDNWTHRTLTAQTLDAQPGGYKLAEASDFRPGQARDVPAMSGVMVTFGTDRASVKIAREKTGTMEHRDFIPGMNLWNARLLGAAWPVDTEERIRREVARLETEGLWHDDLRPWNFILSAGRAMAIDTANKAWRTEPEPAGLAKCLALL